MVATWQAENRKVVEFSVDSEWGVYVCERGRKTSAHHDTCVVQDKNLITCGQLSAPFVHLLLPSFLLSLGYFQTAKFWWPTQVSLFCHCQCLEFCRSSSAHHATVKKQVRFELFERRKSFQKHQKNRHVTEFWRVEVMYALFNRQRKTRIVETAKKNCSLTRSWSSKVVSFWNLQNNF